jgi:predicted thioesterase
VAERRRETRSRKRLRVMFEDGNRQHAGFTTNVSRNGLSLQSTSVLVPRTRVRGRLALPDGQEATFEADVQWARQLLGTVGQPQNAMGLRFSTAPGEAYLALLSTLPATAVLASRPPTDRATPRATTDPASQPVATQGARAFEFPVGLEGRIEVSVGPDDLAAPADLYPCAIAPARAAAWIERACAKAVAARLPQGAITVGVSMQVTVSHAPPVALTTKLTASGKLTEAAPLGRTLTFDVTVTDGIRDIATGRHVRAVAEPRRR